MNYRKAVFVVVYSRKEGIKYLVLKRKKHWRGWEFPKGGIEEGESEEECVRREIKEEVGLRILKLNQHDYSGKYSYRKKFNDRGEFAGQTFKLFSVEVEYGKIKIDENEHSTFEWIGFEEALKRLTWKNQKESLKIVDDFLKNNY